MRRKPLYNWIADGVCLACIIATFVLILLRRSMLPEQIPTHFDLGGNVTGYGGKAVLWLLPGIAFFTFALITVVEFFPKTWNTGVTVTQRNAARVYALARMLIVSVKVLTVLFMCAMSVLLCYSLSIPVWLPFIFVGLIMFCTIFFMIKIVAAGK